MTRARGPASRSTCNHSRDLSIAGMYISIRQRSINRRHVYTVSECLTCSARRPVIEGVGPARICVQQPPQAISVNIRGPLIKLWWWCTYRQVLMPVEVCHHVLYESTKNHSATQNHSGFDRNSSLFKLLTCPELECCAPSVRQRAVHQ